MCVSSAFVYMVKGYNTLLLLCCHASEVLFNNRQITSGDLVIQNLRHPTLKTPVHYFLYSYRDTKY